MTRKPRRWSVIGTEPPGFPGSREAPTTAIVLAPRSTSSGAFGTNLPSGRGRTLFRAFGAKRAPSGPEFRTFGAKRAFRAAREFRLKLRPSDDPSDGRDAS